MITMVIRHCNEGIYRRRSKPFGGYVVRANFHSGAVYIASNSPDLTDIMSIGVWFGPGEVLYATRVTSLCWFITHLY